MVCLGCSHYDKNDPVHCFGTCEIQDQDFRCTHECDVPEEELLSIEALLASKHG